MKRRRKGAASSSRGDAEGSSPSEKHSATRGKEARSVGEVVREWKNSAVAEFIAFLQSVQSACQYVWADSLRNPRNAFVGVPTLVLVLSFVCLLDNGIEHSPIIFVKLAENQVGEYDLVRVGPGVRKEQKHDDDCKRGGAMGGLEDEGKTMMRTILNSCLEC